MVHTELGTLAGSQWVSGVYCLGNPQVATTRQGKPYLKCLLRDATGEVPGRLWSFDEHRLKDIAATGFVQVEGSAETFKDQVQVRIDTIEACEVSEDQMQDLLPSTAQDVDSMFGDVVGMLNSMEHPAMQALANAYLEDTELIARFRMAPAAMAMHHAWIGGLLEHTWQLMRIADAVLPLYRGELNRDFVLMGLFIHDLGKTIELTWEKGFDYTAEGNLVGHLARGAIWLQQKADTLDPPLPGEAMRVLQNIVLSHHGEAEYGALKPPSTPEAVFISMLDNLDAKTQMALTSVQSGTAMVGDFTARIWGLWNNRLYRPRPLDEGVEESAMDGSGERFN